MFSAIPSSDGRRRKHCCKQWNRPEEKQPDDGVGISQEDLQHIFENFYRSPQTKKRRGGSGLGLSLSDQIIRGHGGQITVTSEEERGSCFVFSLPLFTEGL